MKVLSVPVDDGGCGWYRIRQPFDSLNKLTEHDTYVISEKDDMLEVSKALALADIIMVRPGAEAGVGQLKQMIAKQKAVSGLSGTKDALWGIDIDDNVEMISPYSNHYEQYGLEEVFDKNLNAWLWKDGEKNFYVSENRQRVIDHITGLRKMDFVTVTTGKLREYAMRYNNNVYVVPNCINESRWWVPQYKPNKQLRVGWSGGSSHYEDWYSIKEPLNALMRKHQFKLIMTGHSFPGVIDEDNKNLVETHDWVPFKGHSYRMMCMNLDISIIPLADLPFNQYKSSIKWYEMSAMGVPSVVSNILPYSEDIEHGKTALGYNTPEQFVESVEALLNNAQLRKTIASNAHEWVMANRTTKQGAEILDKVLREVK